MLCLAYTEAALVASTWSLNKVFFVAQSHISKQSTFNIMAIKTSSKCETSFWVRANFVFFFFLPFKNEKGLFHKCFHIVHMKNVIKKYPPFKFLLKYSAKNVSDKRCNELHKKKTWEDFLEKVLELKIQKHLASKKGT